MWAAQPPSSRPAVPAAVASLSAPVRAAVRSQAVISTVAEALAEVIANALDAAATEVNVDIALAPQALGFRVQDNGTGVPAASMPLLGQRFATSKALLAGSAAGSGSAGGPPAPCPLGYRGEALAAIREAAGALEVTSRAASSFETLTITLQPGGRAAGPALAPEQRVRQGTVVAVRDLFATQPVRRKALLASGLQREVDRCRDVVLRLALLRPGVTFTLFDRGRRAFVLRLIKGRSELEGVTKFLGRPPQLVAALQPTPAAAFTVRGYAALPPYGQPGTNRQCIYVNGRWVKAAPVAKLVDSVFQQCYKPNVRLLEGQGEELQAVRKASNKHAAFVLHISCSPGDYELAHEAEGELVQFRSWEPLLAAVQRSLLAAWRTALSNSLLKQLEQLEGSQAGAAAAEGPAMAAAPAAGSAGAVPDGMSFQDWLQDQSGKESYDAIRAQAAATAAAAAAAAAETEAGRSSGSGRQRGWSGGQKLSGAKHTLASRLVRYNGATALPFGAGGGGTAGASCGPLSNGQSQWESQVSRQNWEGSDVRLSGWDVNHQQQQQQSQQQHGAQHQHLSQWHPGVLGQEERAPLQHQGQQQQQRENLQSPAAVLWQDEEASDAFSCQVLASRLPPSKQQRREPPLQPLQPQILTGTPAWFQERAVAEQQPAMAWEPASWHAQLGSAAEERAAMGSEGEQPELLAQLPDHPSRAVQHVELGGAGAYELQLVEQAEWWQQEQQRPALPRMDVEDQWGCEQQQPQQEQHLGQQRWDGIGSGGSLRLRLGSSEGVEALIGSWGRPAKGPTMLDAWAAEGGGLPLEQPMPSRRSSRLTVEEQALLQLVAYSSPPSRTGQRPQSAPPHHRPRQRIEVVRRPRRMLALAQLVSRPTVAPDRPEPAAAPVAGVTGVVAAKVPAPGPAAERPQSYFQDTAVGQHGSGSEQTAAKGSGSRGREGPAAVSRGGTAMRQPSVAGAPAAQQAVPDFLRPDAGLDELLATWRRPAAAAQPSRPGAATGSSGSPEGILTLDALSAAAFARLKPATLSREQLAGARALQQVDRKFVPVVCGSLLALVDQHAADERVQLERLRDLLLGPDGQPRAASSQALRTPLPLDLTDAEQQLLEAYQHKAEAWGWRWVVPAQQQGRGSCFGRQVAPVLTHVPLLWGSTLSATDLKLYLHHLHDTCGAGGLPAGVVRVLNSKACRGAIMFGDALHQGQCQDLLNKLAATQLCFSCAHGRPTTVPVVDLRLLQQALRLHAEARAAAAGGEVAGSADGGAAAGGQKLDLSGLKARLQALVQ